MAAEMMGSLTFVRPQGRLAEVADAVWDWEVPEEEALALAWQDIPSVSPLLSLHYRAPLRCDGPLGPELRADFVVGIHTRPMAVRAGGAIGNVAVQLKPEAAPRLIGESFPQLASLRDVFGEDAVSRLTSQVAGAGDAAGRIDAVRRFAEARLADAGNEPPPCRAAGLLRQDPSLPIRDVAASLGISERHLSRRFQAVFGLGPKAFARIARLAAVGEARRRGLGWAETAYACGFADQAHMINELKSLLGQTPSECCSFARKFTNVSTDIKSHESEFCNFPRL